MSPSATEPTPIYAILIGLSLVILGSILVFNVLNIAKRMHGNLSERSRLPGVQAHPLLMSKIVGSGFIVAGIFVTISGIVRAV